MIKYLIYYHIASIVASCVNANEHTELATATPHPLLGRQSLYANFAKITLNFFHIIIIERFCLKIVSIDV